MSLIKRRLSRKTTNARERGVAALEFALTLPIWLAMLLGGSDAALMLMQNQRVDRIAYSVTDIVTQSKLVTKADLNTILLAAGQLMEPFAFGNQGVVVITSLYKPAGQGTQVTWQYSGGGTLSRGSKIGIVSGNSVTMPNGLVLNDNENVIVSEVYYTYNPLFVNAGPLKAKEMYGVAIYKPRLSPLITPPT